MTGNVAIITGSGSGIGAASALQLARHGWNIVINYASRADNAKADMRAKFSRESTEMRTVSGLTKSRSTRWPSESS